MRTIETEHLLRMMIAALIMLATVALGIGERSATLSLVSLAMLSISVYVTDVTGVFRLRQSMANCAALGVVLVSAVNAYQIDRLGQLYAVADLQSYLQYVLLFQTKTPRVYWQLAALSLGQVAIASTLIPGPLFGFVLLAYLFVGILTFALLLLYMESKRSEAASSHSATLPVPGRSAIGGRLSRSPVLRGHVATASVDVLGWGLLRQALLISSIGLVPAVTLFLLLPRWHVENREVASREPLRSVGFSKTVALGELGEVINNPDVVMRVQFLHVHGQERRPFQLNGEPLFRGTVVTRYEEDHARPTGSTDRATKWSDSFTSSFMPLPVEPKRLESKAGYVTQRITAEPLDQPDLCCVFPIFAVQSDPRLRVSARHDSLIRQEDYRETPLSFEVGTTGIVGNTQRQLIPCENKVGRLEMERLLQMDAGLRESQDDPFPGLRATAATVLRDRNIEPQDRLAAAKALDEYLRSSGQYFYSLDPQPRDKTLDPLEDFVTKHRVGHCEYFSAALVMMLRSQNIPARMIIGFKGGEWNPLGMYYQVQQLHAHTWVEVYLQASEIPNGTVDQELAPHGAWLTLDPTEGTQERNTATFNASIMARFRQYVDYAGVLWNNYVSGLNSARQQQTIYEPLQAGMEDAIETIAGRETWRERSRGLANSHLGVFWDWYRRHWFSWRGGLVAAGFSLLAIGAVWGTRWLLAAMRRWGLVGAKRSLDEAPVLEIYRRLETALGKQGLRRHPGQTAYEFAVAAGGDLAETAEHRSLAPLPRRIVEAFYQVRFGGRTLDNLEANAVEHALVELELALARPH